MSRSQGTPRLWLCRVTQPSKSHREGVAVFRCVHWSMSEGSSPPSAFPSASRQLVTDWLGLTRLSNVLGKSAPEHERSRRSFQRDRTSTAAVMQFTRYRGNLCDSVLKPQDSHRCRKAKKISTSNVNKIPLKTMKIKPCVEREFKQPD